MYCIIHTLHFIVDRLRFVVDSLHFLIDIVCSLQTLRSSHPNFVLGKSIQSSQRIFDVGSPNELFHVFPWATLSQHGRSIQPGINSLALLCLISLVAIDRMESTSTMILTMISVIPAVGGTSI
jgi:hypothetical protein